MADPPQRAAAQQDRLVQQLTTVILSHKDLTTAHLGRHWQESILPAWVEQDYSADYLQVIATIFSDLHGMDIRIDALSYCAINILRDCLAEGLPESYAHVKLELLRKQLDMPIQPGQVPEAEGVEDEQVEDGRMRDVLSYRALVPDGMDVDVGGDADGLTDDIVVKSDSDSDSDSDGNSDSEYEPPGPARHIQRTHDSEVRLPSDGEQDYGLSSPGSAIMVNGEDNRRYSGCLSSDDPVWRATTRIQFPEGNLLFPRSLTSAQLVGRRKGLSSLHGAYLRTAMVHQIRPGYNAYWRSKIEAELRRSDPSKSVCYQIFTRAVWGRPARYRRRQGDRTSKRPRLVDLEACLNFVLFKPDAVMRQRFESLQLGEMLNYEERLVIDEKLDEEDADFPGTVTVASTGRKLPVSLEPPGRRGSRTGGRWPGS